MVINLGPYPPRLITAAVRCWGLSPPHVYGSVQVQPRWSGYDITEFRINITNSSNGEVLKQATVTYSGQNEYHYFNETLSECVNSLNNSSISVRATVFSGNYGESVPSSAVEARMDIDRGKNSHCPHGYNLNYVSCNLCLSIKKL